MLPVLTDNQIRNLFKEKIESLEHWLRKLVDEKLSVVHADFFSYIDGAGIGAKYTAMKLVSPKTMNCHLVKQMIVKVKNGSCWYQLLTKSKDYHHGQNATYVF